MGFNSGFKGFNGNHPDMSETIKIGQCPSNTIYSLITISLATCFDPTGSSSGLLYETINVSKLLTFLGF